MAIASAPSLSGRLPIHPGYWLPTLVVIVGLAVGAVYAFSGVIAAVAAPDFFDRTIVGGSLTASVDDAGPVVIYVEAAGATPSLGDLDLSVVGPSGLEVPVLPYSADLRYDRNGGLGTAVGTFMAAQPGHYQIVSAASRTSAVIAIGPDLGGRVADAFGRAGLIAGLGLAVGFALVLVRRQ